MKKFAVIGSKVEGTSKSPVFQNEWLKTYQIEGIYEAHNLTEAQLPSFMLQLAGNGYRGINVTIPHKEKVAEIIKQHGVLSKTAERMGVVNTVIVENDGKLTGDNTDAYGFIQNILHAPNLPAGWSFKGKKAVLIGAGGATRAVIVGLQEEGIKEIILVNRTLEKAEKMAKELGGMITVGSWEERNNLLKEADLLVNCTSQGMKGESPLDINLSALPVTALVTDIVYNPLITPLLRTAEARGNTIIDGLGMLFYQGQKSFYLWNNVLPEVTEALRNKVFPPEYV